MLPPTTSSSSPDMETYDALSTPTDANSPTPTLTSVTAETAILSLAEILRALGLHHAASLLDATAGKVIARNDSPTSLLDHLMRDELRVQLEKRAQTALNAPPSS